MENDTERDNLVVYGDMTSKGVYSMSVTHFDRHKTLEE